jgi:hypothetical protein
MIFSYLPCEYIDFIRSLYKKEWKTNAYYYLCAINDEGTIIILDHDIRIFIDAKHKEIKEGKNFQILTIRNTVSIHLSFSDETISCNFCGRSCCLIKITLKYRMGRNGIKLKIKNSEHIGC